MRVEIAATTDIGQRRAINQDRALAEALFEGGGFLLAVADGLGGHAAGEVASQTAIEALRQEAESQRADLLTRGRDGPALEALTAVANAAVLARARLDPRLFGMATTLVVAWVVEGQAHVVNVGDSRGYLLHERALKQVTEDHSVVEEAVRAGRLTREQAARSPYRNLITRSLGLDALVPADRVGPLALAPGDRLLLCSDGLHGVVPEEEIARLLAASTPDDAAAALIDAANTRGGPDNIAVAILGCEGD